MNKIWKEVGTSAIFWKPQKGDVIEGQLILTEENQGQNKNSMLYTLKHDDGSITKVWGSYVLDEKMQQIHKDAYVQIHFLGLGVAKGGKNAPRLYSVLVGE